MMIIKNDNKLLLKKIKQTNKNIESNYIFKIK